MRGTPATDLKKVPTAEGAVTARPRLTRSAATTARTLAAAEQLLNRLGERFTLQEVAETGHVSLSSIYARFESKEGLIEAVQDDVLTRFEQALANSVASIGDENGGLKWTVARLVDTYLRCHLQFGQIIERLQTIGHHNQRVRDRGFQTFLRVSAYAEEALMRHARTGPDPETRDKTKRIFQVFLYALSSYMEFEEVYGAKSSTSRENFRADCEEMLAMSLQPLLG